MDQAYEHLKSGNEKAIIEVWYYALAPIDTHYGPDSFVPFVILVAQRITTGMNKVTRNWQTSLPAIKINLTKKRKQLKKCRKGRNQKPNSWTWEKQNITEEYQDRHNKMKRGERQSWSPSYGLATFSFSGCSKLYTELLAAKRVQIKMKKKIIKKNRHKKTDGHIGRQAGVRHAGTRYVGTFRRQVDRWRTQ